MRVIFIDNRTREKTECWWKNDSQFHIRIEESFIHTNDEGNKITGIVTDILHNMDFNSDYTIYVYYDYLELSI